MLSRSCGYGTPVEEAGTMIFDLNTCMKIMTLLSLSTFMRCVYNIERNSIPLLSNEKLYQNDRDGLTRK
jgi:hypothetical protein